MGVVRLCLMTGDPRKLAILTSVLISFFMLAGKSAAYVLTHSAAMFADAAESVVHLVATGLAAYSLWYAARPPDADHTYGHGRIAYFSAGFEGALVFAAACTVIYSGVFGLIHGVDPRNLGVGLAIAGGLAVINLMLGAFLIRVGRKHNALILVSNGKHVLTDVWTTAAALVGLTLVWTTGVTWLDPAAAVLIGVLIMWSGISLLRRSAGGLMDRVEPEVTQRLVEGIQRHVDSAALAGFHQLRCRRLNDEIWIDVHVQLPGEISTYEAHDRATRLEASMRELFPSDTVHMITHIEPLEHDQVHPAGHENSHDPLSTPRD